MSDKFFVCDCCERICPDREHSGFDVETLSKYMQYCNSCFDGDMKERDEYEIIREHYYRCTQCRAGDKCDAHGCEIKLKPQFYDQRIKFCLQKIKDMTEEVTTCLLAKEKLLED